MRGNDINKYYSNLYKPLTSQKIPEETTFVTKLKQLTEPRADCLFACDIMTAATANMHSESAFRNFLPEASM
jgi:hypothetical protein